MTSVRGQFVTIAADLRERIALGDTGRGGAVDSEAELGRRYGVSRPTVRKALEELRRQGLVESRHGAGWFVTGGGAFHQQLAIGTFRHAASAVAEAGKVVARVVVDFGFRDAPERLAATSLVDAGNQLLHVRSVRTVDGDPLDVVEEWVRAEVAGSISRDAATSPGSWETLERDGHRIVTVRQTITAGAVSGADAELLAVDVGTPVLLVRRLAIGSGDRPIAVSDHRYLAHRFALEVEFNSGPGSAAYESPGLRTVPSRVDAPLNEEKSA